ncbi:MAG: bifunctional diaminohydroxyphosphoribosylaminopyrimidine deaminase/5-amino-6-(5-phosphoribosylamino)uracil reductase RibD [Armatimonadetes bacterium]|nr:bifunctional diaminohydroxyphosphoribosylaminopyrimidine deaminase/5-amino-6-(5-phosphoribosylamino)uracil reductase RibD [Armatimonadota bacterium]
MKEYMKLCLKLAEEFRGLTNPNPMIGAVLVKDGKIIGKGTHKKAGTNHAEIFALKDAGENVIGSTLYVNLEPCSHFGKTPPCVDRIISGEVKKVVIAMKDPNPLVNGKGIQKLKNAGIEIQVGICEEEAKELNEIYIKNITKKKPFVILKAAVSMDGKIAAKNGDSKWISNELARKKVHEIRNYVDAILIGENTLMIDDPKLNVRLVEPKKNPKKIIISYNLNLKNIEQFNVNKVSNKNSIILVSSKIKENENKRSFFENLGIEVILIEKLNSKLNLDNLLIELWKKEIYSILVEGGSETFTSFIEAKLVDKLHLFISPKIIGNEGLSWIGDLNIRNITDSIQIKKVNFEVLEDNILVTGYPVYKD